MVGNTRDWATMVPLVEQVRFEIRATKDITTWHEGQPVQTNPIHQEHNVCTSHQYIKHSPSMNSRHALL